MGSIPHHLLEENNEGLVCGTCGDEGFTNAFVYCVKCLDVPIHRYCLDEMPKTFYEHVIWRCENCQVKPSQSRKEEPAIARHVKVTHINKKRKKERDIASLIAVTKEVTIQRHIKEHAHNTQKKHKELMCDSSFMEEELAKNTDHECTAGMGTNVFQSEDIGNNIQDNYYICAQAIRDTVWRGSFTVIGAKYDIPGRISAHISTKAIDKVFQEANMMPSLLHLEMRPKIFLWPKSFQECEPSDYSIALYFFPEDPINEKIFDNFVQDMMDKELAMSAPTKNAELLIFTSMVLPHRFQKFQGKYFLWGVFRGKRDDLTSVVSHNLTDPNSSDQRALLKRVDYVEHVDNPISQPTLCEGSEHISNSTEQFAFSKRVEDVVETFVEHVHDTIGQLIPCEGSENIPNSSEIDVIMKLYVDDGMGQPILNYGSEHMPDNINVLYLDGKYGPNPFVFRMKGYLIGKTKVSAS